MTSRFRAIKEKAKQNVHGTFALACNYYAPGSSSSVICNVRKNVSPLSLDVGDLGGLSGVGNAGMASYSERIYTAIFDMDQVSNPLRGGILEFEDGEKYRIDMVMPPYSGYITVNIEPV